VVHLPENLGMGIMVQVIQVTTEQVGLALVEQLMEPMVLLVILVEVETTI